MVERCWILLDVILPKCALKMSKWHLLMLLLFKLNPDLLKRFYLWCSFFSWLLNSSSPSVSNTCTTMIALFIFLNSFHSVCFPILYGFMSIIIAVAFYCDTHNDFKFKLTQDLFVAEPGWHQEHLKSASSINNFQCTREMTLVVSRKKRVEEQAPGKSSSF